MQAERRYRSSHFEEDDLQNVDEARKTISKELRDYHRVAVAKAIEHAFPELHDRLRRLIVFIEDNEIIPMENIVTITQMALSGSVNIKVDVKELLDIANETTGKLPGLKNDSSRIVSDSIIIGEPSDKNRKIKINLKERSTRKITGKATVQIMENINATVQLGEVGGEKSAQITLEESLVSARNASIVMHLTRLAHENRDKLLLIRYNKLGGDASLMRAIADKVKEEPNIYLFIENGISYRNSLIPLLKKSDSIVITTNSPEKYRRMVNMYLRTLEEKCLRILDSPTEHNTLYRIGKILKSKREKRELLEFGLMLRFISDWKIDKILIKEVQTRIDSSPGILFKALEYILTDTYVNFRRDVIKKMRKNTLLEALSYPSQEMRDILEKNLIRSVMKAEKEFSSNLRKYTREESREAYDDYLTVIEELSGVRREILSKVIYVLSIYAKAQKKKDTNIVLSESSILDDVKKIATAEEAKEIEQKILKVIKALNEVGFIGTTKYGDTRVITIMRPLLLESYAKYVEEDNPELLHLSDTISEDIYLKVGKLVLLASDFLETDMITDKITEEKLLKSTVVMTKEHLLARVNLTDIDAGDNSSKNA